MKLKWMLAPVVAGAILFSYHAYSCACAGVGSQPATININPDWIVPDSVVVRAPITTTGRYYVATTGSDANAGTIGAPFATMAKAVSLAVAGDTILVRGGTYHQSVIVNKNGNSSAYITLAAYPGETPLLDGTGLTLGGGFDIRGVILVNGNYVRVSGFTIQDVAGIGTDMGIAVFVSSHIIIDNNSTKRTASAGIGSWISDNVIIRGNTIQDARTTGSQECLSVNDGTNVEVSFNTLFQTQTWPSSCEGLDIKNGVNFARVVGNVVHDVPFECIYSDAFSALTSDIDIYANTLYRCNQGIALNSEVAGTLTRVRVFNNVIHDTNGIGIGTVQFGFPTTGTIDTLDIFNNTIDNSRVPYTGNPTGIEFGFHSQVNFTVRNNIILTSSTLGAFAANYAVTNLVTDHNLIQAPIISSGPITISDPFLIQASPLFVNQTGFDLHLTASSPAINSGNSLVTLNFDFDGRFRPQGSAIDRGAFEK